MKQTPGLIKEDVDIFVYPAEKSALIPDDNTELTLGDLHGNAIKLLYFLIRQNLIDVAAKDYKQLVTIYKKPTRELTEQDFLFFRQTLDGATRVHSAYIRLLGDEFADRGSNDYFTVLILQALAKHKLDLEILFSNHGAEFLAAYKHGFKNINSELLEQCGVAYSTALNRGNLYLYKQDISLQRLGWLIENKLVNAEEIATVSEHWLEKIKLMSYTLDKKNNTLVIYTHAPVGLETIQAMSDIFSGTRHQLDNVTTLTECIDQINAKFSATLSDKGADYSQLKHDVETVIWHRVFDEWGEPHYHDLLLPQEVNGYRLLFVHGHDGGGAHENTPSNVINLDNDLGKGEGRNKGVYTVFYAHKGD